jgi:hypothetical protein
VLQPPNHEQQSIVAYLDTSIKPLDLGIEQAEREITLIREYQARMIVDVMTGQFDVRDAARRLPNDAPQEASDTTDLEEEENTAEDGPEE